MKAIARYPDHGKGRDTHDLLAYVFKPVKGNPACPDRVAWIGGDLDGYGVIDRKASLMATALDAGHEHLPGRFYWHVILSCEPCSDKKSRIDAKQRLKKTAPLLAALHGADRWIAVIHVDTDCPHLHLIFANFDEKMYCRFTYDRSFLSAVQRMEWTPYLDSGKGHHTGVRGPRGTEIAKLRELRKKEDPAKRETALAKLLAYFNQHEPKKLTHDALVETLVRDGVPAGWDSSKLMTKNGKPKKSASVVIDDILIRISYFLSWLRDFSARRTKSRKPSLQPRRPSKPQPQPDLPSP